MKNRKIAFLVLTLFLTSIACNTLGEIRTLLTEESSNGSDQFPTQLPTDEGTPLPLDTGEPPSDETLRLLENTVAPENDPVSLAERLKGIGNVPDTVPAPSIPLKVGDHKSFYVTDNDTNITSLHDATLRYVGNIVYFWVEDSAQYDLGELQTLAHTFEDKIVPTDREFFGTEWNPGIDNDPHIYILYTSGLGSQVAGYFSSSDEIHPAARPDSNAAEMFVINSDNSPLSDPYTYGVLAHEFQHMIHWYRDRNETSWINEGMSELATLLNNYVHTGFASEYISDPDLQLNDWPNDEFATTPHYGAGFIFVTYFLERFGEDATKALVGDAANGLESVDNVVSQLAITDPLTSAPITADDVVLDWGITNFLNDDSVSDGRYSYGKYGEVLPFPASYTEYVDDCSGQNTRDVNQYGFDYITFACPGQTALHFEGSTRTGLLPVSPYSGDYAFWSNKGDESDMTLTRAFDFTSVSSPITLTYQTWYDIETDWDYVYLLASTDNGDTWQFLDTPSGTDTNPTGNSYGHGYTGDSGGGEDVSQAEWIQESVDLSPFAGQQVLLRFEYVTDAAVNGEGLMLDDIAINETGYSEDFEAGDGGWDAQGFARVQNVLPQYFRLALISMGAETAVQILDVPENNVLDIPLIIGGDVDNVTLVVMGATRFTRQTATYRFSFVQ